VLDDWLQEMLFYPDMYTIASKHMNLIAFVLDVPLLLRVLKSMSDNSDAVEVNHVGYAGAALLHGVELSTV
jgi:hypothetical protein